MYLDMTEFGLYGAMVTGQGQMENPFPEHNHCITRHGPVNMSENEVILLGRMETCDMCTSVSGALLSISLQ